MAVRRDERNPKRWIIDFRYLNPSGKRVRFRHRSSAASKACAEAEERRFRNLAAETGRPIPELAVTESVPEKQDVVTFSRVTKEYLGAYADSRLKPSTRRGYAKVLMAILVPHFGELTIDEIGLREVSEFDARRKAKKRRNATRRNYLVVLRSVLRFAVEMGYIDSMPRLPTLPKVKKQIREVMSEAAFRHILDGCYRLEHQIPIALAGRAGLRAGECRGLRWTDVNLNEGYLVVRQSVCHGEVSTPKSGNERKVPLLPEVQDLLEKVPRNWRKGLVALSTAGTPWSEYAMATAFKRVCKRIDQDGWRFHDLRHFFVTSWLRAGVPPHVVQAIAGHADLKTTDNYAHATDADLESAVQVILGTRRAPSAKTS